MTHPLTRVPFFGQFVDERFLEHRRRASSLAGFSMLILAAALFEYRYFHDHLLTWDLFALIVAFAVVKFSAFAWYRMHD